MLQFYYINTIYLKLIKQIFYKIKLKNHVILQFMNKTFYFLFFKVLIIKKAKQVQIISIPTYTDYLITFVMQNVLEEILRKKCNFKVLKNSFDFFNEFRYWPNIKWCLKGCITQIFSQINLFLIGQLLFKHISDILILNLYFRFISSGYFLEKSNSLFFYFFSMETTLGYLLINIYLHELDQFMVNFIKYKIFIFQKESYICVNNLCFYLRVGFFWFVGLVGEKKIILCLKKKLIYYLFRYLHLRIKEKNIQIINLFISSFFFFGLEIKSSKSRNFIQLLCPIQILLFNLKNLGFLKYSKNKLVSCAQRKWLAFTSADIFWKYYLLKLRLFKLYFFATNFSILFVLQYFLKISLIFTLGRKLQLTKKQISIKFKSSLVKWMS